MVAILLGFFIIGCVIGLLDFLILRVASGEWQTSVILICGLAGLLTPIGAIVAAIVLFIKNK